MVLLQCHRLSHAMGTKALFRDLDMTINAGDRIGLVGHNGSGKSTLLSLLNGSVEPDTGDISRSNDLFMETVEQFIDPALHHLTLFEALAQKLPAEEKDFSDYKVAMLLEQLGFGAHEFDFGVGDLSGGQQNRLMFARAVLNEPNLILFDEPTNHLDLRTLLYFEDYLKSMDAAYLIISHDREFLDAVTNRTLFLRDGKLYSFGLPFSQARQELDAHDEAAEATRRQEEKAIKTLQASAKRLATWGKVYDNEKFARRARNMEKRIERMEASKTFVSKGSGLNLELDVQKTRANRMLHIEDRDIHVPGTDTALFYVEEFFIRPGDRVALLGHNGVGKTTLIKQIMDRYENDPEGDLIRFNPQCEIGYYDQELENLSPNRSMVEILRDHCRGADNDHKSALIKAGFPYTDVDKKVRVLSGGEKARLMFLIMKLNRPNFLILDEPTNHIDIEGKEELETQLLESDATVLITSHDRRFVDNIADRYALIHDGVLREIHDPADFYALDRASTSPLVTDESGEETGEREPESEDEILQRIVILEQKLAEDLARKPKFQKPERQAAWRAELEELNRRL